MVIYMYIAPGMGADLPLGYIYFKNHKYSAHLPISIIFFPLNDILTIFLWTPYVDLAIR